MKRALAFSAFALSIAVFGVGSQPSIAIAQGLPSFNIPNSFSGLNFGISGGGASGSSSQHDDCVITGNCIIGNAGNADGHYNASGWLLGGGGGYNWQNGPWVAGITGDLSGGSVKGSSPTCGGVADTCGTKLNQLGTVRGLLGYSDDRYEGRYLVFITAGPAWGHISAFDTLFAVSGSKLETGVAFGGGLDIMLSRQVSFKIEYLRVDFGKSNFFDIVPGTPEQVSLKANIIRAGLTFYPR
jgi:opacity protein-like surface antigen